MRWGLQIEQQQQQQQHIVDRRADDTNWSLAEFILPYWCWATIIVMQIFHNQPFEYKLEFGQLLFQLRHCRKCRQHQHNIQPTVCIVRIQTNRQTVGQIDEPRVDKINRLRLERQNKHLLFWSWSFFLDSQFSTLNSPSDRFYSSSVGVEASKLTSLNGGKCKLAPSHTCSFGKAIKGDGGASVSRWWDIGQPRQSQWDVFSHCC